MLRVLIVEDEVLVAGYLEDLIDEAGHTVVGVAATGEAASIYLSRGGIDLVVLDIKLKGAMSGIDVAYTARAHAVPHVFVTGSGDPTTRAAAEATEPLAFIQKPIHGERLVTVLAKVLADKL